MTTETEYVKVKDRVRVVEGNVELNRHSDILVFAGGDAVKPTVTVTDENGPHMRVLEPEYPAGWASAAYGYDKARADAIRATLRLACEAVRERCAEAALSAGTAGGYPGENAKRYHAEDIAFIIRGLEL